MTYSQHIDDLNYEYDHRVQLFKLSKAAERAEAVMEHTARKLAALPLVQNDMAMDLIQAAAELRKARRTEPAAG